MARPGGMSGGGHPPMHRPPSTGGMHRPPMHPSRPSANRPPIGVGRPPMHNIGSRPLRPPHNISRPPMGPPPIAHRPPPPPVYRPFRPIIYTPYWSALSFPVYYRTYSYYIPETTTTSISSDGQTVVVEQKPAYAELNTAANIINAAANTATAIKFLSW